MTKGESKVNGLFYKLENLLPYLLHWQGFLILQPAIDKCRICKLITFDSLAVIHIIIYALSSANISMSDTSLNEASVNNQTRQDPYLLHLFENSERSLEIPCLPINLDQDAECNIAGFNFLSDHVSIDH